MLVDSGAIVNLMPYLLYKKVSGTDDELIKTNMMINNIGGGDPILARAVAIGVHKAMQICGVGL